MTVYGRLIGNSFDILNIEETDVSLVRKNDEVRLIYKDDGKLVKYVKLTDAKHPVAGDYPLVLIMEFYFPQMIDIANEWLQSYCQTHRAALLRKQLSTITFHIQRTFFPFNYFKV